GTDADHVPVRDATLTFSEHERSHICVDHQFDAAHRYRISRIVSTSASRSSCGTSSMMASSSSQLSGPGSCGGFSGWLRNFCTYSTKARSSGEYSSSGLIMLLSVSSLM